MDYNYELDIDSLFYSREANEVIIKTTDKKHQVLIKIPIASLEEIMNRIEIKKREEEKDEKVFHTPISSEYMPVRTVVITPPTTTHKKLTDDERKKIDDIIKKSEEFDKMIKSSEDILRNVTSNFQPSRLFYVEVDAFQKYMNEIDERFKELETRVTNIEIKREEEEDNGKSNKEEG